MTMFTIYIITILSGLKGLAIATAAVGGFVSFMVSAAHYGEGVFDADVFKKIIKISIPISVIAIMLAVLIPTTNQAAAIYLIPRVVNNEQMQSISEDGLSILEIKAQQYLRELRGGSENKGNK